MLKDKFERAMIYAITEKYISRYKDYLLRDGYYIEGIGYWSFGFNFHVMLAEILYRYTNGRIDLYEERMFKLMAPFPYTSKLTGKLWIPFADVYNIYNPMVTQSFLFATLHKRLKIKEYSKMSKTRIGFPLNKNNAYFSLCDVNDLSDSTNGG